MRFAFSQEQFYEVKMCIRDSSLTEGREANISEINDSKSEFKIEHTGTAMPS